MSKSQPPAVPEDISTAPQAVSDGSDSGQEDAANSGANTPLTESSAGGKTTLEERAARMEALRAKMRDSTAANRKDLIEENDEWEKRKARKERRADFQFHDDAHAARRKYKKDLDLIKPDLAAYQAQKEAAIGQGSAIQAFSSGSSSNAVTASEQLYRDANTLLYGDNKPSEEAIDRVVGKLNQDIDKRSKFSRKRNNEEEGDITYINERNRVFNKKIARFYDKYTAETRASFERGTAL
ncbi:hypothetical protein RSAG8_00392, partial [Rhizoctonia solani AG-8 WAC10335]